MIYVGVDIGGTSIKVGFCTENGEILSRFVRKIIKGEKGEDTIKIIAEMINEHAKENNYNIEGIGIGCPGAINSHTGYCDYSANLGWEHLDVTPIFNKICGCNAKIANDANAATLGEAKFGGGKGYNSVIMLTLGTGVGGGIFIDNHLYEGNEGKGGELGHALFEYNGRQCACGRKGCFERYASATALIMDTKEAMEKDKSSKMWDFVEGDINKVDGRTAFETSKLGDKTAQAVVDQYIHFLATGIISFSNIFRPQAFILGGGICGQGDYLIKPIEKILKDENYGYKNTPKVEVLVAKLGNDAGILGAAALVM